MRIVHIQGIFSPEHGGPAHSLSNYCLGLSRIGHQVSVYALEGLPNFPAPAIRLPPPVETVVCRVGFPAPLGRSAEMRARLAAMVTPDIVHLHGVWLRTMYYGAVEARRRSVPYLVEMMGMYEPYGLRQKWCRKRIARWWFQDTLLRNAACLHVNSIQEGRHVRQLGVNRPFAVIPVGVDTVAIAARQQEMSTTSPWPELGGRPFFLYLSRIHPKKGIELLLKAWSRLAIKFQDPQLLIAGAGTPDYVVQCKQMAKELGIDRRCLWAGPVTEEQKTWALSNSSFFVLPSYSENFGNVVAEALAHRSPVITTNATPWDGLEKQRCGWIASPTADSLSHALDEALSANRAALKAMGTAGQDWCNEEFSLSSVLESVEQTYLWLTGGGVKPKCVLEPNPG